MMHYMMFIAPRTSIQIQELLGKPAVVLLCVISWVDASMLSLQQQELNQGLVLSPDCSIWPG